MSTLQIDAVDHQRNDEENCKEAENGQRLMISSGARCQRESLPTNPREILYTHTIDKVDKASVIKYDNGLAYPTANKAFFQQVNATCERALTQIPSSSSSKKPVQRSESKANKPAEQLENKAGEQPGSTASKELEKPTSEPGGIAKKPSNLLSTHARLVTRLDGALDRLETLAGSKHRGYAGMKAWTYHFDAVADLMDALAKMEKRMMEDKEIGAFVAGEERRGKLNDG